MINDKITKENHNHIVSLNVIKILSKFIADFHRFGNIDFQNLHFLLN